MAEVVEVAPETPAVETPPVVETPPPAAEPSAPAAESAAPAEPAPETPAAPSPWTVPGPKYKQTVRELREVRDEYTRFKQEFEPLKSKLTEAEQEIAKAKDDREQLGTLLAVLDAHPELRNAVLDGVRGLPPRSTIQPSNGKGQTIQLPPDLERSLGHVGQLVEKISRAEQEETNRLQQARRQEHQAYINTTIDTFLRDKKLDPAQKIDPHDPEASLRDDVIDFIVSYADKHGAPDRNEMPHVMNQWWAREQERERQILERHTARKTQAAKIAPPAAPPTATPVAPAPTNGKISAIGSREHKEELLQHLREKGWR